MPSTALKRALGVALAMAIAPLPAVAYATAKPNLREPHRSKLKRGVGYASEWLGAATVASPHRGDFKRSYRVPLWLDIRSSDLSHADLLAVLHEVNEVWSQANICFEVRDVRLGDPGSDELLLRLMAGGAGSSVFGMYDGHADMWVLDRPELSESPHPVVYPAARTASHELGHALGLRHFNRQPGSVDALMSSGYRGYRLNTQQITTARNYAAARGVPNRPCATPRLLAMPQM